MSFDLHLASASPRRKDLLNSVGLQVDVCPAHIDESPLPQESPTEYVQRLSLEKATAATTQLNQWSEGVPCLGADTIVVCAGELFGKPRDQKDAIRMWQAMSANQHQVLTAVAVLGLVQGQLQKKIALSVNHVTFKSLTKAEMVAYWNSGEPQDKAGAYGIQGFASAWVANIQGSFSGIMGLPLYETNELLRDYDLHWL